MFLVLAAMGLASSAGAQPTNLYTGTNWALLDAKQVLAAAADITLDKYPDCEDATVDERSVRVYHADGTAEAQDENFVKVLTEKGKRNNRTLQMGFQLPYNNITVVRLEVIKPDGTVVPDVKRNLPGRGLWVTATRTAVETAVRRKLFAKGFKREVRAGADLAEVTDRLLERAALDSLSIAGKAGTAVTGVRAVAAPTGKATVDRPVAATVDRPVRVRRDQRVSRAATATSFAGVGGASADPPWSVASRPGRRVRRPGHSCLTRRVARCAARCCPAGCAS